MGGLRGGDSDARRLPAMAGAGARSQGRRIFARRTAPQDEPDQVEHVTPIGYQPENETVIPGGPPQGLRAAWSNTNTTKSSRSTAIADLKTNQVRELEERQFDNLRRRLEPLGVTLVDREMPSRPHPHNRHHGGSEGTAGEQSMPVQATAPESLVIPYVRQDRRVYKRCFTAGPVELECAGRCRYRESGLHTRQ